MAKNSFEAYGGKVGHFDHKEGKIAAFSEVSGGPIDPFGDMEKKEKDTLDMNAGESFNKKDLSKIEAMGTDYPKKSGKPGQFCDNSGDHFTVEDVSPSGDEAGKTKSYQTSKRA
jgi:hypothetical protein